MLRSGCDGGFVTPEVRIAFVYKADKSRPSTDAGVFGRVNSRVDFRVDYDIETRSGFTGHNLNASVGLSF